MNGIDLDKIWIYDTLDLDVIWNVGEQVTGNWKALDKKDLSQLLLTYIMENR